jgi:hypothetical protein
MVVHGNCGWVKVPLCGWWGTVLLRKFLLTSKLTGIAPPDTKETKIMDSNKEIVFLWRYTNLGYKNV